jgi:site-specific DNA recombinase
MKDSQDRATEVFSAGTRDSPQTGRARSIGEIARREHLTARHVRRVMRLAFLAPRIVEAIVEGRQPADLSTLAMTQRIELPPLWSAQQQALESR